MALKLPQYLQWRDGRPRWELGGVGGKKLRDAGFKSRDLKDAAEMWLGLEAAMTEARALNSQVQAWREGKRPEDVFSHLAQTPTRTYAHETRPGVLTIKQAATEYMNSDQYRAKRPSTRKLYAMYLTTLVTWMGDIALTAVRRQDARALKEKLLDVQYWIEQRRKGANKLPIPAGGWQDAFVALSGSDQRTIRQLRLKALEAALDDADGLSEAISRRFGYVMVYDTMRAANRLFNWADEEHDLATRNPFAKLHMIAPKGRIRYIEPDELELLVNTADEMGAHIIGTAWIMAVHTGQRRADLISKMTWRIRDERRFDLVQQKTSTRVEGPVSQILQRRLDDEWLRLRQSGNVAPHQDRPILISPNTNEPISPRQLTFWCQKVRLRAAQKQTQAGQSPTCADILLHDGRDTAVTRLALSGNDLIKICSITGHNPNDATTIWRGYLTMHPELSTQAIQNWDEWHDKNNIRY